MCFHFTRDISHLSDITKINWLKCQTPVINPIPAGTTFWIKVGRPVNWNFIKSATSSFVLRILFVTRWQAVDRKMWRFQLYKTDHPFSAVLPDSALFCAASVLYYCPSVFAFTATMAFETPAGNWLFRWPENDETVFMWAYGSVHCKMHRSDWREWGLMRSGLQGYTQGSTPSGICFIISVLILSGQEFLFRQFTDKLFNILFKNVSKLASFFWMCVQ